MPNLNQFLPVLDLVLFICLAVGGFFAMKAGYFQQAGRAQEQALDAMDKQIQSQELQLKTCSKRIARLEQERAWERAWMRKEMEKRGMTIEFGGETITIVEQGGRRVSTVEIHLDEDKPEEKEE